MTRFSVRNVETQIDHVICHTCGGMCERNEITCPKCRAWWNDQKSMNETKELDESCVIGQHVKWTTMDGQGHAGTLCEWDNGTAIIMEDSKGPGGRQEIAVRA